MPVLSGAQQWFEFVGSFVLVDDTQVERGSLVGFCWSGARSIVVSFTPLALFDVVVTLVLHLVSVSSIVSGFQKRSNCVGRFPRHWSIGVLTIAIAESLRFPACILSFAQEILATGCPKLPCIVVGECQCGYLKLKNSALSDFCPYLTV